MHWVGVQSYQSDNHFRFLPKKVKREFQNYFHSFWTQFKRTSTLDIQFDFYSVMGVFDRRRAHFLILEFFLAGANFLGVRALDQNQKAAGWTIFTKIANEVICL